MNQNTKKIVRKIRFDELAWVNSKYTEIQFKHSDFENEIIAVAEMNSEKAGLGRLVSLSSTQFELGGMCVFEQFRKHGLAKMIVKFLLEHTQSEQTIFCLPFAHLKSFYEKFGFQDCSLRNNIKIPDSVRIKHDWCNKTYDGDTLLLVKSNSSPLPFQYSPTKCIHTP